MVVVGGAWPALVALTPASEPSVDLGHERQQHPLADLRLQRRSAAWTARPAARGAAGGGGGGGNVFGGATGPLRLLNSALGARRSGRLAARLRAGQRASALLVGHAAAAPTRAPAGCWRSAARSSLTAVLFSAASGIFHPYYVSLLAPFAAALVGAGAAQLIASGDPRADLRGAGAGRRSGDRADRAARLPGSAELAAAAADRRVRCRGTWRSSRSARAVRGSRRRRGDRGAAARAVGLGCATRSGTPRAARSQKAVRPTCRRRPEACSAVAAGPGARGARPAVPRRAWRAAGGAGASGTARGGTGSASSSRACRCSATARRPMRRSAPRRDWRGRAVSAQAASAARWAAAS